MDLKPLALIHDGDSFSIDLEDMPPSRVRILRVIRFPYNQNSPGTEEDFRDLDIDTRKAIVQQINRRHVGRTIVI